jgi:hypothetical protein
MSMVNFVLIMGIELGRRAYESKDRPGWCVYIFNCFIALENAFFEFSNFSDGGWLLGQLEKRYIFSINETKNGPLADSEISPIHCKYPQAIGLNPQRGALISGKRGGCWIENGDGFISENKSSTDANFQQPRL